MLPDPTTWSRRRSFAVAGCRPNTVALSRFKVSIYVCASRFPLPVQPQMVFYQSPVKYGTCGDNYQESLGTLTKSMIPRFVDSGNKYWNQSATPLPSSFLPGWGNETLVRTECDSQSWPRSASRSGHCLRARSSSARTSSTSSEVAQSKVESSRAEKARISIRWRSRRSAMVSSAAVTHLTSGNPH